MKKYEIVMTKTIGKNKYEQTQESTKFVEVAELTGKGADKVMQGNALNLALGTNKGWIAEIDNVMIVDRFPFDPEVVEEVIEVGTIVEEDKVEEEVLA